VKVFLEGKNKMAKLLERKRKTNLDDKEEVKESLSLDIDERADEIRQAIIEEHFDKKDIEKALEKAKEIKKESKHLDFLFELIGENISQMRPQSTLTPSGKICVYDPKRTREWKAYVRNSVKLQLPKSHIPTQGRIVVTTYLFKQTPKSFSKTKTILAEMGIVRPEKAPDVDNYYKAVTDSLKNVLWRDDAQVITETTKKFYSLRPRLLIKVRLYLNKLD
jgi:Holliday junction resolvase RusA-like endonuclease